MERQQKRTTGLLRRCYTEGTSSAVGERRSNYGWVMTRLEVAVLGDPVVRLDGEVVALQGRQLVIVLRLALAGRVPVSRSSLLDSWPDGSGTDGALRVALTRVRAVLGSDLVRRVGHGYMLDPAAEVDADAFVSMARRSAGDGLDLVERRTLLDEALGLWTADAFAGVERIEWVEHQALRLTELREQSIDRRFELCLDAADDDQIGDLVPELVEAARRRPEREHRAALAATALYCAGRQTEALALIAQTRSVLVDSYGLDPGRELSDLETAILRHDVGERRPVLGAEVHEAITSRLRAASALVAVGVDEALAISREAADLAREHGARDHLGRALLLTAQSMRLVGDGDTRLLIVEAQQIARAAADGSPC